MELRQLRYFIAVSEAGSLLRASRRVHLAQPALGQQITALEDELGTRLFDRSSRGMALTEAGKVFLEHAHVVLADAERARLAVRESTVLPQGDVSLGLTTTVSQAATLPILSACRTKLPRVRLRLIEAYSGFLRERLQSGRLDLALLYDDSMDIGLSKRALLDDPLVFVTQSHHELPNSLPLRSVTDWPLILPSPEHGLRRLIDDACAPLKLQLDVVAEVESLGSVKRAVEAGIGNTILPQGAVAEEVASGRLSTATIHSPNMRRRVVCATNAARPDSAASTAVYRLVLGVIDDMVRTGAWPAKWLGETM